MKNTFCEILGFWSIFIEFYLEEEFEQNFQKESKVPEEMDGVINEWVSNKNGTTSFKN